jgi:hypothetical protein
MAVSRTSTPKGTCLTPGDAPTSKYVTIELYGQPGISVVPVAHAASLGLV